MLQAERVQPILVEQHLAPIGRGQVEGLEHDDGVGRAHLYAQLAELARVQLEREGLGVVPLLRLQHLDLDHLRRTDELAEATADARLLAAVRLVDQRQDAAEAVGIDPLHRRVLHGDRLAEEVTQGHAHRLAYGRHQLPGLAEERRGLRRHRRSDRPRRTRWPAAARARWAAAASTRWRESDPPGCARRTSGSR